MYTANSMVSGQVLEFLKSSSTQVPATRPQATTAGSGWPEQCPPMQAAAAFGWAGISGYVVNIEGEGYMIQN